MDASFIAELLKLKNWAPATVGAGLTILYLNYRGVLGSISNDDTWIPMLVIVAAWFMIIGWLEKLWNQGQRWWHQSNEAKVARDASAMAAGVAQQEQAQHVERMGALTADQKITLGYIKHKGNRDFQAYAIDKNIIALNNLRYILRRAYVEGANAMFHVPQHVWDAIVVDEDAKRLTRSPWEIRKNRT